MKIFRLFTIAAAALILSACSEDIAQMINGGKKEFTATIAAPNKGGTRTAYNESGGDINVAWTEGDEIALIHNGVKDVATVKTVNADGSATITGFITKANNGDGVEVCYPAAAWEWAEKSERVEKSGAIRNQTFLTNITTKQDGTLKYIQDNLDTRMGKGTLKVDGDKATLSDNVTLASQIAIWKLTLQDDAETPAALSATQVSVKLGGEKPWTVAGTTTLGTATSIVYLAIDKLENQYLTIEATVGSDTYKYENEDISLALGQYYQSTVTMANAWDGNLATVTKNVTATDGTTIYGTLGKNVMISIADGATVTLDGVTINGVNDSSYGWAGITCLGDATIILKDGSTNTVTGFYDEYPGIHPAVGKTLTIKGTGSLTASSNGFGTGIGGGFSINCGNIIIEGGTITATGGQYAAAIGSGGNGGSCGAITITSGVTSVTATKGASAPNSIGAGKNGTCGTVTIGCTLTSDGNPAGGTTGAISTSPYTYPAPAVTGHALSAAVVGDVVGSDGQAYDGTDYNNLPTGVTAVAKVCYVSGGHGLALALADESSAMDWSTAITTAAAHTPTVTGGTWKLATKDEWNNMITAAGGYTALRNGFTSVGGSNLDSNYYWSSTEYDSSNAWTFLFSNGSWDGFFKSMNSILVRACLAF